MVSLDDTVIWGKRCQAEEFQARCWWIHHAVFLLFDVWFHRQRDTSNMIVDMSNIIDIFFLSISDRCSFRNLRIKIGEWDQILSAFNGPRTLQVYIDYRWL